MYDNTDSRQWAQLGARRVCYSHREGTGVPLLVLGDYAVNAEVLTAFCDKLSCPCLIIDWPATLGEAGAVQLRMPGLAAQLVRLLDALGVSQVNVLGMGWGGLLAQALAYRHAGYLRRLILVATSTGQVMWPGRLANLRRLGRRRGLADIAVDGREARAIFGGRADQDCARVAAGLSHAVAPSPRALVAQLYALAGFSSLLWAHRIRAPSLILAGDDDPIVPMANARLLALLLSRAELSVMHGAGHWLLLEREAESIRRIEAFLALGAA